MSDRKRYVRNRTGGPAFLKGSGVVPAGEIVEVKADDDNVDTAIEAGVFAADEKPQADSEPKAATGRQTNQEKEGGS